MYDPTVARSGEGHGPQRTASYPATLAWPRRRPGRVILFVIGLIALACCVGGVTAALVGQALDQADDSGRPTPGIGDPVRDGQFEFVVSGVTCGRAEIVNGILRAQAQGQFCIVEMTVSNVGREPRHFADGHQKAYGPAGQVFAADTNAGVFANGSGAAVWNVINPGNQVAAKVVFDIPATATIETLELHDSALSGGVRVSVAAGLEA